MQLYPACCYFKSFSYLHLPRYIYFSLRILSMYVYLSMFKSAYVLIYLHVLIDVSSPVTFSLSLSQLSWYQELNTANISHMSASLSICRFCAFIQMYVYKCMYAYIYIYIIYSYPNVCTVSTFWYNDVPLYLQIWF